MSAKAPPAATKAEKIKLKKRASVEDALAIVFEACLRHWTANRAATLSGDSEGVHEMRVALRRTRVALSDFREVIPSMHLARMKRDTQNGCWRNAGARVLTEHENRDEPVVKLARRLLTKRHKTSLRLGRNFKRHSDRERHRLRIALKKFRYTAEFFRSLYQKKRQKAYFHALTRLQDSLGRMNDVVAADLLLKRLCAAPPQSKNLWAPNHRGWRHRTVVFQERGQFRTSSRSELA